MNALAPAKVIGGRTVRGRRRRPGHRSGLSAVAGDRARRPERSAGGAPHRLAARHHERDRVAEARERYLAEREERTAEEGRRRGEPKRPRRSAEGVDIDPELIRKLEEFRRERLGVERTSSEWARVRTCVGCRKRFPQAALVRFVRERPEAGTPGGASGRGAQPGRGAYLCSLACVAARREEQALPRSCRRGGRMWFNKSPTDE